MIEKSIYDHVKKTELQDNDLGGLVNRLVLPFQHDDLRKAECIYLWIKLNVRYDFPKFYSMSDADSRAPVQIDEILTERMGICDDFAFLAKQMFDKAGIRCEIIGGIAKPGSESLFTEIRGNKHAWNAIFLNGSWTLVDCTWASLSWASGDPSDYYFGSSPEEMIYSHYPDDGKWTLLSPVPSLEEFKEFPLVTPLLFSFRHGKLPTKGFCKTQKESIEVPAFLKIGPSIEFELEDTSTKAKISVPIVVVLNSKGNKVYKIPIARKGVYIFRIGTKIPIENITHANLYNFKELMVFGVEKY
jgi:hypothetical protein